MEAVEQEVLDQLYLLVFHHQLQSPLGTPSTLYHYSWSNIQYYSRRRWCGSGCGRGSTFKFFNYNICRWWRWKSKKKWSKLEWSDKRWFWRWWRGAPAYPGTGFFWRSRKCSSCKLPLKVIQVAQVLMDSNSKYKWWWRWWSWCRSVLMPLLVEALVHLEVQEHFVQKQFLVQQHHLMEHQVQFHLR